MQSDNTNNQSDTKVELDDAIVTEADSSDVADNSAEEIDAVDEVIAEVTEDVSVDEAPSASAVQHYDVALETSSTINSPAPLTNNEHEGTPMADAKPRATSTQMAVNPVTTGNFEDWTFKPSGAWPPPVFLKPNATPRERFYIEYRWFSQWDYYDKKASEAKSTYYRYQTIVVIGALLIPALVSLNSAIARFIADLVAGGSADSEAIIRIGVDTVTVFVSLLVAGSAAIESLYKFGDTWNSYRSAAEELQAEKNVYDMSAGPYESNPNPFATFVTRVEGIVANQNGKYFQAVQAQIAKQSEENENLVESFLTDDDEFDVNYANTPESVG
ncbi:MAG: DUF4231 domain-containing protein [Chloroflexota bacterium]